MVATTSSPAASDTRSRLGKDHLVLADWPLGTATFQQRTGDRGEQRDFAEFVIDRPDCTRQKVTLESPSRIGLPTAADHDMLIALLLLAKRQEFRSDVVPFVPWQLLQILGWHRNQASYRRLRASLKRLKAVTATYENVWYSRTTRKVESFLVTGILAEAKVVCRPGRRFSDRTPESYVQFTRHMHTSLEEGSVVDLDLGLYFSCKRPGTKHLLRHLNKVWHAGKKPKPYARDLQDLACGHLGMTDCKDLKRNFQNLVAELEGCGYLKPLDPSVRYQKIRAGVWRVNLELHPDQQRQKGRAAAAVREKREPTPSVGSEAAVLVRLYHCHRFGKGDYVPQPHEIARAKQLLKEYELDVLNSLTAPVARSVEQHYRGEDLFFGSAVPYFAAAAKRQEKQQRVRDRAASEAIHETAEDAAIMKEKRKRRRRREKLLHQWRRLSQTECTRFLQLAMEHARSEFDRRRISKATVDDPPREALEEMDRHGSSHGSASHIADDLSPSPGPEAATEVPAAGGRPGNGSTMR